MNRTAMVIFASALLVHVTACTVAFYNATVIEPKIHTSPSGDEGER